MALSSAELVAIYEQLPAALQNKVGGFVVELAGKPPIPRSLADILDGLDEEDPEPGDLDAFERAKEAYAQGDVIRKTLEDWY